MERNWRALLNLLNSKLFTKTRQKTRGKKNYSLF